MQDQKEWELSDLTDANGALGRPLQIAPLLVPDKVFIDEHNARVVWSWKSQTTRQPNNRLLNDFVALADASNEHIAYYALRYGPLSLCEHYLPSSHSLRSVDPDQDLLMDRLRSGEVLDWNRLSRRIERCKPMRIEGSEDYWEPLSGWRRYAKEARAILSLTTKLNRGITTRREDIAPLHDATDLSLFDDFYTSYKE
ncbi:MAG TPA: hypothetical protein VIL85_03645, partial [Thermomicrobiales bacterium]